MHGNSHRVRLATLFDDIDDFAMSGYYLSSSFGEPDDQPRTPTETTTLGIFPSPVVQTPKNNEGLFNEASAWPTPHFAEDYSVFNTTPGNLRADQAQFVDCASFTPYSHSAGQVRPLSVDKLAAEIASHVNHFSSSPNLLLPPVDPSRCLQSSPRLQTTSTPDPDADSHQKPASLSKERVFKTACRSTTDKEEIGQTATPPPSAQKSKSKPSPKPNATAMQNDQDFGQVAEFVATLPQANMNPFVASPNDMFGFPISAPATAPGFENQCVFWDQDASMAGMEIDLNSAGLNANQLFRQTGKAPEVNQETGMASSNERPLATRPPVQNMDTSTNQSMLGSVNDTPIVDPFSIMRANAGGVDPGLLFSRPQTTSFTQLMHPPGLAASPHEAQISQSSSQTAIASQPSMPTEPCSEPRRSASIRETASNKKDWVSALPPTKFGDRPKPSRSFSENRGKKPKSRAILPVLAPAPRSKSIILASNTPVVKFDGTDTTQTSRPPSRRRSPLKSHHHQSGGSLSSIPESGPRTRNQAKLVIDANGQAYVESTTIVEQESPMMANRRDSLSLRRREQWKLFTGDHDSSSDDEPIIIPSRSSFALPDPRRSTRTHQFHNSTHSLDAQCRASLASLLGNAPDDPDSELEMVVVEATPRAKALGDAANELQKVRDQRRCPARKPRRFTTSSSVSSFGGVNAGHGLDFTSQTLVMGASLSTPLTDLRTFRIRCVCKRNDLANGSKDFMVRCESCEMWLHGGCINLCKRPSRYICAFCAQMPSAARGARLWDGGGDDLSCIDGVVVGTAIGPPASMSVSVTRPLAHKPFKFR